MAEYRKLYWNQREWGNQLAQSRTHLYPEDRQTALCGQPLPRGDRGYDVMWDDTDNPVHVCRKCAMRAAQEER